MPGVERLRESSQTASGASDPHPMPMSSHTAVTDQPSLHQPEQPETICLWLPSSMPSSLRTIGCTAGLIQKETKLRLAQADDALNDLRRQLRISATLRDHKNANIGGTSQRMATRMRTLMTRFHDKTHRSARRYCAAYNALSILDPNGAWRTRLRPLNHSEDLRLPWRDEDEEPSEGRRQLSWIWLVPRDDGQRDGEQEYGESKSILYS